MTGIDQVPAEGETLQSEVHKLINSIWIKEELPEDWRASVYQFTRRVIKLTSVIIEAYHCY
jgi:hypothetical protein